MNIGKTFGFEDDDREAKRRKRSAENEPRIEERREFPEMEGLVTRLRRKGGLPPRAVIEETEQRRNVQPSTSVRGSRQNTRATSAELGTIEEFVQQWMRDPGNEGKGYPEMEAGVRNKFGKCVRNSGKG